MATKVIIGVFALFGALLAQSFADEPHSNTACFILAERAVSLSNQELSIIDDGGVRTISLEKVFDSIVPVSGTNFVVLVESDKNYLLDVTSEKISEINWIPDGKICTCAVFDASRIAFGVWARIPAVKRVEEANRGVVKKHDNWSELLVVDVSELRKATQNDTKPVFERVNLKEGAQFVPAKLAVWKEGIVVQLVSSVPNSRKGKWKFDSFSTIKILSVASDNKVREIFECEVKEK